MAKKNLADKLEEIYKRNEEHKSEHPKTVEAIELFKNLAKKLQN
jgi:hypothetical protein